MILGVSEQFLAGAGAAITLVGAIGIALLRFMLQALKEMKRSNSTSSEVPERLAVLEQINIHHAQETENIKASIKELTKEVNGLSGMLARYDERTKIRKATKKAG